MINFRDLSPTYEIESRVQTVDDLLRLGCSPTLIDHVFPDSPMGRYFLARPEDWFWQDAEALGDTEGWSAELHQVTGGNFAQLPLEEQCELLDLPMRTMQVPKGPGKKWLAKDGRPVSPEEAALSHLLQDGEIGTALEGRFFDILNYIISKEADRRRGRAWGLDYWDQRTREPEHVEALIEASRRVLLDPGSFYAKARPAPEIVFRQRAMTKAVFLELLKKYDAGLLGRMLEIGFKHRSVVRGHVDLTILNGRPRFYEVKTTDRLRGTQGQWIRNVARPLSLDVGIIKLVAADEGACRQAAGVDG